jgi:sulfite exporter TauE/SafE
MITTLIEGFTLGFSTGTICLVSCTPIYLPYLISENRSFSKNIWKVLEISLGRFFSYIVFGLLAGWIGSNIATINRDLFTGIAYSLLSLFLILSVIRTNKKEKKCHIPAFAKITSSAFLLGVFTGINFCPSFLIALSKAVDLAGPISGALLFLGFFFGTSIFLIPLAFSGFLAYIKNLKYVAQLASIAIAVWFLFSAGLKFYDVYKSTQAYYLDPSATDFPMTLIIQEDNQAYFAELADSLFNLKAENFALLTIKSDSLKLQEVNNSNLIYLIDADLVKNLEHEKLSQIHYYEVEAGYPVPDIIHFLKNSVMKLNRDDKIHFSFSRKH